MHDFKILAKQREPIQSGRLRQLTVAFRLRRLGARAVYTYAFFACECGTVKLINLSSVRSGNTASCGCIQREQAAETGQNNQTHGGNIDHRVEYLTYRRMLHRCGYTDGPPQTDHYLKVNICDRWLQGFDNFLADMGPRPGEGYSIDREDPNGNYEPSNCRWLTTKENIARRRKRA